MGWGRLEPLLGAVLLLLLAAATTSAAPPPAEAPPRAEPPPENGGAASPGPLGGLGGLLGQAGAVAGGLLGKLQLPAARDRIRTAYEQGSAAVVTYTGILSDQLYHWWQGDH